MGKTGKGRLARRNVLASAAAAVLLLWLVLAPSGSNNRNVGAMMTAQKTATVGIVITVSGAPLYVTECLESLYKNTPEMTWVYVSDDSPTDEVAAEIRSITEMLPRITYLRVQSDDRPAGYTVTANLGLSTSYAAGHDVSVMVNSDTVFTPGWLPPLLRAIQEDPRIGMAGPMSNAATYQSTPLVKANGGWATNMPYPTGWNTDKMARLVQLVSAGKHANVPILNGFVFAIRREVIRAIGVFDVEKFPKGYGEENDYAFRARAAGYEFVVCTNSFVQHYMSKSFGHTTRKKLSAEASVVLKAMYKEELAAAAQALDSHPVLAEARRRVAFHLKTGKPVLDAVSAPLSVLFVLNAQPQRHFNMRGGWVAVVQEALGLADNGAYVRVAVPAWQVPFFNTAFPDAEAYGMFFGYNDRGSDALAAVELVESGLVFDIGVATHYLTVEVIRTIRRTYPSMIPAFYIQDVENRFAGNEAAVEVYQHMKGGFAFAKTQWLVDQMASEFGVRAHKIAPTVDTARFNPVQRTPNGKVHVCAMVRVETPRRNPEGTLVVLQALMNRFPNVTVSIFGSPPAALEQLVSSGKVKGINLAAMNNIGIAERDAVTAVMQQSDIFIDASTWQAFGQTGLEAMACGCVPVLPLQGGASEYAEHGVNSLLVDTADTNAITEAAASLISGQYSLSALREAAIMTAQGYSVPIATGRTYQMFKYVADHWPRGGPP